MQQLGKAKVKKSLASYKKNFFQFDTVRIIGFIEDYSPALEFTSGIIYSSNELTREDSIGERILVPFIKVWKKC